MLNTKRSEWVTTALIGLIILALVSQIQFTWISDDLLMREWSAPAGPHSGSVISFLSEWLPNWSSRIAIGAAMFIFTNHLIWWRLLTAFAFWLVIVLPVYLVTGNSGCRRRLLPLSGLLLLSIPGVVWFDAGLVATTANYLWVLAAGLVAAVPAIMLIQQRTIGWYWYLAAIPTALYAASFEIAALILAAIYAYAVMCLIYRVRSGLPLNRFILTVLVAFLLLFIGAVVWHIVSPGNAARGMPSWSGPMFPILFERAYSSTLRQIFMSRYLIPLVFFTLIVWRNYRRYGLTLFTYLALIPIAGSLLLRDAHFPGLLGERITGLFTGGNLLWDPTGPQLLRTNYPLNLAAVLLLTVLLAATIAAVISAFTWGGRAITVLAVLGAGFASKFIVVNTLGLALDNDFHRTDLFLLYAFIISTFIALLPQEVPSVGQ